MKKIVKNSEFEILFEYNPRILEDVKLIPGRRFDYIRKIWFAPLSSIEHVERFAKKHCFDVSWERITIFDNFDYTISTLPSLRVSIPLKKSLYPFQEQGVAYNLLYKKVIVGDQPGLGKTAQAVATVIAANAFPCLVICPSSLKINWQREFEMWSTARPMILSDSSKNTYKFFWETKMNDVFIANYESLKKYFVAAISKPKGKKGFMLKDIKFRSEINMFKSVIVDESHRCKDVGAQQTKFVKGITHAKEYVLLLTGTPVVNNPRDLISPLAILDKLSCFGGYNTFEKVFVGRDDRFKELNVLLHKNCFYRREKKDVLTQLPDKVRQAVYCDITTRKEYQDAMKDLADYLKRYRKASDENIERSMRGEIMVRIGILKNISARGKIADVIDYISDIVDSGEKIILFTHLKEVSSMLRTHFPGFATILGEDSFEARQVSIDQFQNDPKMQGIICSIKAAGVGLTLTASSRVAFVELPWHPADCDQCEDRAHRIGQKDSVQCTYFLGRNTIDEHIFERIGAKRYMSDQITGAKNQVEERIFDDMIKFLTKESDG